MSKHEYDILKKKYEKLKEKFTLLNNEFIHTRRFLNSINADMDLHSYIDEIIISIVETNEKIQSVNFALVIDDEYMVLHDASNIIKALGFDSQLDYLQLFFNTKINYRKSDIYLCVAVREDKEIHYEDINKKQLTENEKIFFQNTRVVGVYILPVKFEDKIIGSVGFFSGFPLILSEYEKNLIRNKVSILGYAIEQNKLYNALKQNLVEIENKNKVISEDLQLAMRIQKNLIPVNLPLLKGVKIATRYFPMFEVGGDYFDFHYENSGNFSVILTDASGHGVSAAFITSMLKIAFNSDGVVNNIKSPAKVLQEMNKSIIDKTAGNFVTAVNAYFNLENHEMKLSCAGHNPVYKINRKTGQFEEIHPKGRILCLFDDVDFEEIEIPLSSGDRFFLYTDGLTEAVNHNQEEFEECVISMLKELINLDVEELCEQIVNSLRSHALFGDKNHYDDDIAITVIDIE